MTTTDNNLPDSSEQKAKELEEQRSRLLDSIASSQPDTLEHKVGWILNNYPETRNSDISLQLCYWNTFHHHQFDPNALTIENLYRLPRLTSLVRARARIQNQLKLFVANQEVRRRRGTLEEVEKEKAAKQSEAFPVYAVYIDESGKTQSNLVIGSLWILHGPESWRIASKIRDWRATNKFTDELHYTDVKSSNLQLYKEAISFVIQSGTAISFKFISVPRAGTGAVQSVIPKLIYHLLIKGVEHEHGSGRAPLPRNLLVWKDAEEKGYDQLLLAELADKIKSASATRFNDRLVLDTIQAVNSKGNDLIQIADVFTGCINRMINPPEPPPSAPNPKDELSVYVRSMLRVTLENSSIEQSDDMAVRLFLSDMG